MSVAEILETKSNLKAWIDQLSDGTLLNMLEMLRLHNADQVAWEDLSDYQRENISKGLDDIENGRVMTSEEFWHRLKNS